MSVTLIVVGCLVLLGAIVISIVATTSRNRRRNNSATVANESEDDIGIYVAAEVACNVVETAADVAGEIISASLDS